jgi:hypothetical protein
VARGTRARDQLPARVVGRREDEQQLVPPGDSPSVEAASLLAPFSPPVASATLVGVRAGGKLTSADQQAIDDAGKAVSRTPQVERVADRGVSDDGQLLVL